MKKIKVFIKDHECPRQIGDTFDHVEFDDKLPLVKFFKKYPTSTDVPDLVLNIYTFAYYERA